MGAGDTQMALASEGGHRLGGLCAQTDNYQCCDQMRGQQGEAGAQTVHPGQPAVPKAPGEDASDRL